MALQDHVRPPLSVRRHWHAFHNAWATYISSDLNQRVPAGYFAEAYVQQGVGLVIVDVVTDHRANLHNELLARLWAVGMISWDAGT